MERNPGWTLKRFRYECRFYLWLVGAHVGEPLPVYPPWVYQRRAFADNRRARLRAKRAARALPKWMRREMARTEGQDAA